MYIDSMFTINLQFCVAWFIGVWTVLKSAETLILDLNLGTCF